MDNNFTRAAELKGRIEKNFTLKAIVPHWIKDNQAFWYRWTLESKGCQFVLVDLQSQHRRPAFDHAKLATALKRQGIDADAQTLPFTAIELSNDLRTIRFQAGGKGWEFRDDSDLQRYNGKIHGVDLKPMDKESPSGKGSQQATVTFVNHLAISISLYWIDWEGNAKFYETVAAHQSSVRETYVTHVWRVCRATTGKAITSFQAVDGDSVANIDANLLETGKSSQGESHGKKEEQERDSGLVYVQASNVWCKNRNNGWFPQDKSDVRLSNDGSEHNPYDGGQVYTSPDGRFSVVYQYTPEQQHLVYEVEAAPRDQVQPKMKQFQYLKPGDRVRIDRPKLFDLLNRRLIPVDTSLFSNPYRISNMGWLDDNSEYLFRYNQRGHQVMSIIAINTKGYTRAIVHEESRTFIDYTQKQFSRLLKQTKEMIWTSERSGWNHLYLYDLLTGQIKTQITNGPWVVASIERVDEQARQVWVKAYGVINGQDPYYAHLVRANLDGSGCTVLTGGNGTHTWKWSPDRKYFIDTWSRVDSAPSAVVRDAETGKQVVELETSSSEALERIGWTIPERFVAPGRDGKTLIYGILIYPSRFDPKKKYPVLEQIYAGPQDFFVPKAFSALPGQHELAELGFIVVQIDGMGTNFRSKSFQDVCYKNLKDSGFPDRIAWMKAAARERPWMDLSRVGVYGGSAGGQSAMAALLWHGDFYKAAAADCGCHDNRMDKLWWNEQWMGWPVDKSYEDSSNVVHAHRLKGALMLIVGELDNNVDPASTMQVVNALNKAGKDYELLFMPGEGHGVGSSSAYAVRRQRDFFIRHLMQVTPPKRNEG